MWVQILATTMVLVFLSKTLYHICFSSSRIKWGTCEGRVSRCVLISHICADMAAIELYTPQGAEMVFRNDLMRLMSRGNNVQRLDLVARICALYKNPIARVYIQKWLVIARIDIRFCMV